MRQTGQCEDRFEEALREWGGQPPRTPAGDAARLVLRALPERPRALGIWRPLAACAALLVMVLTLWLLVPGRPPADGTRVAEVLPPPVDEDVVVWWIDAETPVYFATPSAESRYGGES